MTTELAESPVARFCPFDGAVLIGGTCFECLADQLAFATPEFDA